MHSHDVANRGHQSKMSKRPPARDIKLAVPRTREYINMLVRKHGATAEELQAMAVAKFGSRGEGVTKHNSYSLGRLADTYGFECFYMKTPRKGGRALTTYQFRRPGEPTSAFGGPESVDVVSDGRRTTRLDDDNKRAAAAASRLPRSGRRSGGSGETPEE